VAATPFHNPSETLGPFTLARSRGMLSGTTLWGERRLKEVEMTAVIQWREVGSGKHWAQRALPEPPRHSRLSKTAQVPSDKVGRDLEEWLGDLTVASTHGAD
jgi:hypothetical protein